MNRELKRKGIISIAVHTALIIFLIIRSFISCHRIDARNISPFIDLQMGGGAMPKGGADAEPAATRQDDAFPEPARKSKGQVDASKKLVKKPLKTAPKKQLLKLSESEIKRMLGEGVVPAGSTAVGIGAGLGGGGTFHPYAWYYNQIKSAIYEVWQQPSSLVGKKGLVTTVEIRVQRDGRITRKKIASPSGNAQMDDSVLRALESVNRFPELPAGFGGLYKDITIDFELTEAVLQPIE